MITAIVALALASAAPGGFDRLKTLSGTWTATGTGGRHLTIRYRLIANDSVLVEQWVTSSGRETMTVFHRDGAGVMATHYCAQGNQPRLALSPVTGDRLEFTFHDATNLTDPAAAHQHAFSIRFAGPGIMIRTETYRAAGRDETETLTLERTAP